MQYLLKLISLPTLCLYFTLSAQAKPLSFSLPCDGASEKHIPMEEDLSQRQLMWMLQPM